MTWASDWLPGIGLPRIDFATWHARTIGPEGMNEDLAWIVGMVSHFLMGVVLALGYHWVVYPYLPLPRWVKGLVYGLFIYLTAMIVYIPIVHHGGLFGVNLGPMIWLGNLLSHAIYGVTLGLCYKANGWRGSSSSPKLPTANELPVKSTNEPTKEELKETHSFLVKRVYLETELLNQRIYNFTATSAFLAAALAVGINVPVIPYIIATVGLALSVSFFSFGVLNELAITFWREYLRRVEVRLNVVFDRALFMFYEQGSGVDTIVGTIKATGPNPRLMKTTRPWCWVTFQTTSLLMGGWVPGLMSVFWLLTIGYLIYRDTESIALVLSTALVFVVACGIGWRKWIPSTVEGQETRHA
jgi:hypothetical protein